MTREFKPGQLAWVTSRYNRYPRAHIGDGWRWFNGGESVMILRRPLIKDFSRMYQRTYYDFENRITWARHYCQQQWVIMLNSGEMMTISEKHLVKRPPRKKQGSP